MRSIISLPCNRASSFVPCWASYSAKVAGSSSFFVARYILITFSRSCRFISAMASGYRIIRERTKRVQECRIRTGCLNGLSRTKSRRASAAKPSAGIRNFVSIALITSGLVSSIEYKPRMYPVAAGKTRFGNTP